MTVSVVTVETPVRATVVEVPGILIVATLSAGVKTVVVKGIS